MSGSGVLTTASGVVFAGDGDGNIMAFDSRTGDEPVALPARVLDASHRGDDLYARRPSVFAGAGGEYADRVCAAAAALRLTMKLHSALALLLLGIPVGSADAPPFTRMSN